MNCSLLLASSFLCGVYASTSHDYYHHHYAINKKILIAFLTKVDPYYKAEENAKYAKTKTTGQRWDDLDLEQLDELEDDEDDQVVQQYRQQRLAEMKKKAAGAQFGAIIDISGKEHTGLENPHH